jgi:hypothetical protein
MKGIFAILCMIGLSLSLFAQFDPPCNLTATAGDQRVVLNWSAPGTGGLTKISYHDGAPNSAFYQLFDQGYGVVFDLSAYPNSHPARIDFRHSPFGSTGPFNYRIHIINWTDSTHVTSWTSSNLTTSTNDGWENSIQVDPTYFAHLGVFIEPLSGTSNDAWPVIDYDEELSSPTSSFLIDLTDNSVIIPADSYGDFLVNLWIDTEETQRVQAPRFAQPSFGTCRYDASQRVRERRLAVRDDRDLLGYVVYRDSVPLNSEPIVNCYYTDTDVINNTSYTYTVKAVYTDGESEPTPPVQAIPHVAINQVWYEDFEDNNMSLPNDWINLDQDGDGNGWAIASSSSNYSAHSGSHSAISFSYLSTGGAVLTPNNYLISPEFVAPTDSCSISFWVRTQDDQYPNEHYAVALSNGGITAADFSDTLFTETLHSGAWHNTIIPILDHSGDTLRVAIIHCECTNNFAMKVDDIGFYTGTEGSGTTTHVVSRPQLQLTVAPNPFNPSTEIAYNLPENGRVQMKVYNVKGQLVTTLVNEVQNAGSHSVVWRGTDSHGNPAASGVYFARIQTGTASTVQKMLLMK